MNVLTYEQLKQRLDAANCILSEFKKVGDLMLAQDNRCTDQPMFIVFEKVEVVSHEDYDHDRICWIYDSSECDKRTSKRLEALHQGGRDCGEYQRVAVKDIDRFVTACFSEQGCKDYLAANGHNLRQPFIYAAGSFRNSEYQSIRKAFMAIAKTPNIAAALADPVMKELNFDPSDPDKMQLPAGKTCGDCGHIRRCKALFGHVETDTYCDWSPSRAVFVDKKVVRDGN